MSAPAFVVYGKERGSEYSVRTASGEAVCTCAYNSADYAGRYEWAELIVAALNAYPHAVAKATGEAAS